MSVAAVRAVLKHSKSTLSARLVMLVLADAAHDDGVTWLGQKEIASKARISRSTVDRTVDELLALPELEQRKAQRGRRRINVYRLLLAGLDEPNYDDMPFTLTEPFTVSHPGTQPENDDVPSWASTVSQSDDSSRARDRLSGLNRNLEPSGADAPESGDPPMPPFGLIDGRNVPLDALIAACAIDGASPRANLAAIYLNGSAKKSIVGIRQLYWLEATRYATSTGRLDELAAFSSAEVEHHLASAIVRKSNLYRQRMAGTTMGPKALHDWWLDLEKAQAGAGMTPEEIANFDRNAD